MMIKYLIRNLINATPKQLLVLWAAIGALMVCGYAGASTYLHYLEFQSLSETHPAEFSQGLKITFFSLMVTALVNYWFISATLFTFSLAIASFKYAIKGGALISSALFVILAYFCCDQLFGAKPEMLADVFDKAKNSFWTDIALIPIALAIGIAAEFFSQTICRTRFIK